MSYILIHGLGQDPASWDEVVARLPAQKRFYRPSLPHLAGPPLTYQRLSQAFAEECDHLPPPLFLCGISLGAVLALQYALDRPGQVGSLILIAPQYKMPKVLLSAQNTLFRLLPPRAFHGAGFSKEDMIALAASMKGIDLTSRLRKLACPTLLVCGRKDRVNRVATRRLAARAPGAAFAQIDHAGHQVNTEAPATLARLIHKAWFSKGGPE